MDIEIAVELCRRALALAMQIGLPILTVGLVVGLVVSVAQAATQIQEQTLSFIPKMAAMVAAVFLLLPWVLSVVTTYTHQVLSRLASGGP